MRINYARIARAISHYERLGYTYVEVPWIVSDEAVDATLPPGKTGLRTQDGPLVGSAEQSFIQLMVDGAIGPGRYVAATPCFRDDEVDALHQRWFFKVEIIDVFAAETGDGRRHLDQMILGALAFFETVVSQNFLSLRKTGSGFDIEVNGVEVGSYGIREWRGHRWVYGTGLAEPRFSIALEMCR